MTRSTETMIDFFLREKGELIQINGVQQIALIRDATDKIQSGDEKIIRAVTPLHTGDIIDYRNERFLITSEIDHNEQSNRGRIRKCNYSIAFNWDGNVKWFNAILEGETFSVNSGTIISVPTGAIHVYLQDNADTKSITLSQRFYNTHQPFKVNGIDRTVKGIIKLSCSLDTILSAHDDVDNNIVDRWKYEIAHTYALTIDNVTTTQVLINDVLQLNYTATDNGKEIPTPAITFTSSDANVVSVDNQGNVMGRQVGQEMITAKLTYHPSISDTIQITTVEEYTHNYNILISGNTSIYLSQTLSYTAIIYLNGVEVFDQSVQWMISNQNATTPVMAAITARTGNSVTIKAVNSSGYVNKYLVLSAILTSNPTITIEKTIQIKSLL